MDDRDEEPDLDDLRQLMHERVDAAFDQADGPLGIQGAALQLCGQRLKAAESFIDTLVGREMSARAIKSSDEAETIGWAQRDRMKAARCLVDGETPTSTTLDRSLALRSPSASSRPSATIRTSSAPAGPGLLP